MIGRIFLSLTAASGLIAITATASTGAASAPNGQAIYARCAACHTQTGAGVPGAFPPLGADFRRLAAKPAGRRYLVLVIARGVAGPLTVEGQVYRNVMPSQSSLSSAEIAAVLNFVGTTLTKSGPPFTSFSLAEVNTARASGANLSSTAVGQLHAAAGGR